MAVCVSCCHDEMESSGQVNGDKVYICIPRREKTSVEVEELFCLPIHENNKLEGEKEETDEEEQILVEVLCAERVGQMTKTYNDIDAVTRLLEEKERDLELAARIGQSLLKKNKTLSDRNEILEEQVEHIREEISQLRHDLSMKDELLQFFTNAAEESEGESRTSTPVRASEPSVPAPISFPLDSLQKKLKDLEEENKSLRSTASHLETETISYEEKEQQLVNVCVKELRDANLQISTLAEELARKADDGCRQQEEITHLLSQIVDLQKKAKLYAVENEELTQHLGAAKDAQRQLTAELCELQDKYAECMEMLHEAQEELKNLRNKSIPLNNQRRFHSLGLFPMDSLAAEIEGTMRKELQMDDPDIEEQRLHPKRVFQTVKNLNLMRQQRCSPAASPLNIPGSNQTSCFASRRSSGRSTPVSNANNESDTGSGLMMDNRSSSVMGCSYDGSEDSNRLSPQAPGSRDLEAAIHRLSLRRDNYLSEKRFFEDERERKLAYLAQDEEKGGGEAGGAPRSPTDSLVSLCSHPSISTMWSGISFTPRSYLPEKLQIVKPLEGSLTLHAWQQLAQPHMGALLDHRPGVVTKGFCTLAHEQEQDQEESSWQLTQPEEDEDPCDSLSGLSDKSCAPRSPLLSTSTQPTTDTNQNTHLDGLGDTKKTIPGKDGHGGISLPPLSSSSPSFPLTPLSGGKQGTALQSTVDSLPVYFPGKCSAHTSSTYTFTTCRILHPSDQLTSVSPSPAVSTCQSSTGVGTPTHTSSPLTFSTSSTPSYTPCCTPRRLSLSHCESSTNLRDSTKTTSTSLGLARLLLERGISASVYNPCSWDRGLGARGALMMRVGPEQRGLSRRPESEVSQAARRPDSLPLQPYTPPSSPTHKPASPIMADPTFQFSPLTDDPPYHDAFLASKPARMILREVLMEMEREKEREVDDEGQAEVTNLGLVDKLKRFRTLAPPSSSASSGAALLASFGSSGLGSNTGLPGLNVGLKRNRSFPAVVGASMAMKDPGGSSCSEVLMSHASSHAQRPAYATQSALSEHIPKPEGLSIPPPPTHSGTASHKQHTHDETQT